MKVLFRTALAIAACFAAIHGPARAEPAPLTIVAKMPLPGGRGRIDHLACDPARRRLYVAELGNNSVAVIDVAQRRFERRLTAPVEPQGIAYFDATDMLYVAGGGDGVVRALRGTDLSPVGSVDVGSDADNIRVDADTNRVYVGSGDGALTALDARTLARAEEIPLKGHPEGFQLSASGTSIFVNIPGAGEIAVVDRLSHKQVASWPVEAMRGNFPMAIDGASGEVLTVFRSPAKIVAYHPGTGKVDRISDTCGDADDLFVDRKRSRIYVICGAGFVDVLARATLGRIARIATAEGARTGLFVVDDDRLFIGVRETPHSGAAVWELKPD